MTHLLAPALMVFPLSGSADAEPTSTVERWGGFELALERHAPEPETGQIGLAKGPHEIREEFFGGTGGQEPEVAWSSPSIDPQPIPAERLLRRSESWCT